MSRGAPAPEDVLFAARVLPVSSATEETVAPGNELDPTSKVKGPFRRFAIDLAASPTQFHLATELDGRHTGKVDFTTFVYDDGDHIVDRAGQVTDQISHQIPISDSWKALSTCT